MARTHDVPQLAAHFRRPQPEITQALRFEAESRRLKQSVRKEKIGGKLVTIITYAAEWAGGAKSGNVGWLKNSWF